MGSSPCNDADNFYNQCLKNVNQLASHPLWKRKSGKVCFLWFFLDFSWLKATFFNYSWLSFVQSLIIHWCYWQQCCFHLCLCCLCWVVLPPWNHLCMLDQFAGQKQIGPCIFTSSTCVDQWHALASQCKITFHWYQQLSVCCYMQNLLFLLNWDVTPPLSLANSLWIGNVPLELKILTLSEHILIAHFFSHIHCQIVSQEKRSLHLGKKTATLWLTWKCVNILLKHKWDIIYGFWWLAFVWGPFGPSFTFQDITVLSSLWDEEVQDDLR